MHICLSDRGRYRAVECCPSAWLHAAAGRGRLHGVRGGQKRMLMHHPPSPWMDVLFPAKKQPKKKQTNTTAHCPVPEGAFTKDNFFTENSCRGARFTRSYTTTSPSGNSSFAATVFPFSKGHELRSLSTFSHCAHDSAACCLELHLSCPQETTEEIKPPQELLPLDVTCLECAQCCFRCHRKQEGRD